MTLINWEQPFYFALATGDTGGPYTGDPGTIPLPTYGNYGGADFSEGSFGGTPDTNTHGSPYLSFSALINDTDPSNNPLSPLDYAFYKHDVGTELASSPQETTAADLALIKDIQSLDRHGQLTDPEDSLYAGGATLGMILDVELNGTPKQIQTAFHALPGALENVESGLAGLVGSAEFVQAASWLTGMVDVLASQDYGHTTNTAIDTLDFYLHSYLV